LNIFTLFGRELLPSSVRPELVEEPFFTSGATPKEKAVVRQAHHERERGKPLPMMAFSQGGEKKGRARHGRAAGRAMIARA
jgi:hypothetical protein